MAVKDRKGFVYTLEAIIASILLLTTSMVIIPQIGDTQADNQDIQDRVRAGLEVLDKTGDLRDQKTTEEFEQSVSSIIPDGYNHKVLIKDLNKRKINLNISSLQNGVFRDRARTDSQQEWIQGSFNEITADRGDELFLHYPFDEGSGDTAYDKSLNSDDGSINGAEWTAGKFGKALRFNRSTGDNVTVPEPVDEVSFTVVGWAKPLTKGEQSRGLVESHGSISGSNGDGWLIQLWENDKIYFYQTVEGDFYAISRSTSFPHDGEFHQFALSVNYNGTHTSLTGFVNGKKEVEDQTSGDITPSEASNTVIGDDSNAVMDEIRIYGETLDEQEIRELYHKNRGRFTDLGIGYENGTKNDGLKGYWRLDRNTSGNGGTVIDYSGEKNNGTTYNGINAEVSGVFGTQSFEFDGQDSYVAIDSPLLGASEATICLWAYKDGYTQHQGLVNDYENNNGERNFLMREDPENTIRAGFGSGQSIDATTQGGFTANEWHHVCSRFKGGSEISICVDNDCNEISTDIETLGGQDNNNAYIGLYRSLTYEAFNGSIDEIRIYNRSLSENEIQQLYFNGHEGSFTGNYSKNFTLPEGEVPKKIQVNSENVDSSGNVSWVKVWTDRDESAEFKLDAGSKDKNYSLGFSEETKELAVKFNFSVNNETPEKSPVIDNFKVWVNDSAEESYYIYEKGSAGAHFHFSSANNLNVSFNRERLVTNHSSDEEYKFKSLPDSEGYLKFFGTTESVIEVNSKSVKGEPSTSQNVKNANYIINKDGIREVTISLWE